MASQRQPIPRGGLSLPQGRGWQTVGIAALVVGLLLPLVLAPTGQMQPWLRTVVFAEIYGILALGLNVVVGFAGLLDLGYAAFFAIGAYTFGLLGSGQSHFFLPGNASLHIPFLLVAATGANQGIHLNFWLALPLCGLVAALFGVVLGAPTLRLRGDYLAIVTFGFGEIVPEVITNLGPDNTLHLANITNGTNNIVGIDQPNLATVPFSSSQVPWYYLGLVTLVAIVLLAGRLENSRLGRAWVAMREDELAAACMGINLTRTKLTAFAMGAFFSGIAGLIDGSHLTTISPDFFGFDVSITILTMVVLGGMGSIPGVLIGAIIISALQFTLLDQLTNVIQGLGTMTHSGFLQRADLTQAKNLIFGLLLVLMMIYRREGLFPSSRRRIELRPATLQEQAEENVPLAGMRGEA